MTMQEVVSLAEQWQILDKTTMIDLFVIANQDEDEFSEDEIEETK